MHKTFVNTMVFTLQPELTTTKICQFCFENSGPKWQSKRSKNLNDLQSDFQPHSALISTNQALPTNGGKALRSFS